MVLEKSSFFHPVISQGDQYTVRDPHSRWSLCVPFIFYITHSGPGRAILRFADSSVENLFTFLIGEPALSSS